MTAAAANVPPGRQGWFFFPYMAGPGTLYIDPNPEAVALYKKAYQKYVQIERGQLGCGARRVKQFLVSAIRAAEPRNRSWRG